MRLTKIDPADPLYKRAVKREGEFWQGQSDDPVNPAHLPAALVAYKRQQEGGERFEQLAKRGPFKRALSIGCGSANVEVELLKRGIVQEFTFIDISETSLQRLRASLPADIRKRTRIIVQDLNFIDLERDRYDLVFCANVLHHIINLEHVLLELNKSLAKDGVLFIDDFIGESRFQFSDARIAMLNRVAKKAEKMGVRTIHLARTSRKVLINSCPFEAVRSDEILPLITEIFGKTKVRHATYGNLTTWMNVVVDFDAKTPAERKRLNDAAKMFIAHERKTKLPPLSLHGIYRKNRSPPRLRVEPWTRQEMRQHLPVSRFDEGVATRLGGTIRQAFGNGVVYNSLRRAYLRLRG